MHDLFNETTDADTDADLNLPADSENEEDLTGASASALSATVVQDTDWTTETLLSQLKKQNIKLNPRFQRRDAWDDSRKSKFIESLLLGLPIPQIVLAESNEKRGTFIVIDGKQRLLALQKFGLPTQDGKNTLRLKGLTLLKELNDRTFADIQAIPKLQHFLPIFENQTVRTTVIRGWKNEDILYTIFYRLNSGSLPLSAQELRHVLHPGAFLDFAFEFTDSSKEISSLFSKRPGPDFRMRDVELLIRHLGFKNFSESYGGDLKKFLDSTSLELNQKWASLCEKNEGFTWGDLIENQSQQLDAAIAFTKQIFPNGNAFKKWTLAGYEQRFNRAIFDVMTHYFSDPSIREVAAPHITKIREAFESLCDVNTQFRRSIETTTKTPFATFSRLALWGQTLSATLNSDFPAVQKMTVMLGSTKPSGQ
jgi:hypothetical protein